MSEQIEEIVAPAGTEETSDQPKPAVVPETTSTEGNEDQKQESEQQKQEQDQEQRHRGGFQRKIDKLTSKIYQRDLELAEMRGRLAVQPAAATTKPEVADDPMPNKDTWTGDYESLIAALARWHARQEHKAMTAKEREETAKAEREERDQEVVTSYRERMQEFVGDHDDFVEVVNRAKLTQEISGPVQVAIMEDEQGPALAYYLGENPEVCQRLNEMTAAGAVKYLGRISERLFPETSDEEEVEERQEEEADSEIPEPPPARPKLERPKLPAPISPTRRSAPTDNGLSDSLSPEEWARRFNKKMGYDK